MIKSERLKYPGAFGTELAARLDRPAGPRGAEEPAAYALFAHCFTCSKDLKAVGRISRALVARGIAVLRFDFTGLGESEGDFADTNFSSNLDDLLATADYLRQTRQAPKLLIGHSLGGAAVLAAAARVPESVAVATIGAPSDTRHLKDTLLRSAPELAEADEAEVVLGGRTFRVKRQFLDDLHRQQVLAAVGELGRALLIFHSPVDEVVDVDHARRIYQAAPHPKSFVSLDGADHLLLADPADGRWVAEVLASWAGRYLGVGAPAPEPAPRLEPREVWVSGGREKYRQRIRAGRHELTGDEPRSVGGGDLGPTPYDLLLAALGTCTSMTLRMYADRKGWDLDGAGVRLRHRKVHAKDCEECATEKGRVDRIDRRIELRGELDGVQRARLMEIADRCPVHRTLTSETVIRSREDTPAEAPRRDGE